MVAKSSFLRLSSRLLLPADLAVFFCVSICFSTHSISFNRNSVLMISMSRTGLTSPSTWTISASEKAPEEGPWVSYARVFASRLRTNDLEDAVDIANMTQERIPQSGTRARAGC